MPANRLELDVDHLVMAGEELDSVAIRVAHIDELGVTGAMPARAALYLWSESSLAGNVTGAEQSVRVDGRIGDVVEARSIAAEEDDVVWVALALQEDGGQIVVVRGQVLAEAEAEPRVELTTRSHRGSKQLEVVEPLRAAGPVQLETRDQPGLDSHAGAELERDAGWIVAAEGASLVLGLRPGNWASEAAQVIGEVVELVVLEHPETQSRALAGPVGEAQRQAVMCRLLEPAEEDGVSLAFADDEADYLAVEAQALVEIPDRQLDVTRSRDRKGERVVRLGEPQFAYGAAVGSVAVVPMQPLSDRGRMPAQRAKASSSRGMSCPIGP